jgi:Microtubule binding
VFFQRAVVTPIKIAVSKSPETVGMIPRAVDQVFQVTEELKSKGWEYTLEGQFLEIVRIYLCPRYGIS